MSDTTDFDELLTFAAHLADAAARVTLPLFRNLPHIDNKEADGFDPVTEADRGAEAAMREMITTHYPSHAITGEEFDDEAGDDFEWVLDPIDGTRAFISGIPTWGTLIGLNYQGTPVLGMMDQPFTGERFFGARGQGSLLRRCGNDAQIKARRCESLDDAVLASTTPELFTDTPGEAKWQMITNAVKLTRYGGDCYNYALLAMGQLDIVMEQGLKDVDIQPLIALIEEAGGIVTDWQGGTAQHGGTALACGDHELHAHLLDRLNA